MFLRTVKATSGGEVREYLRLVETYREGGKIKQRVIQTLGRKDQLIPHLDTLIKLLAPEHSKERLAMTDLTARSALTWGPVVVARHLWDQLGLGTIVRRCCRSRNGRELADRAFVLTASRFCSPSSEHGLAWWLDESYVTDSVGRRYAPVWKKSGRVQVDSRQLARWYRTLDALIAGKDQIEREVYLCLRDLFSLKVDLVFYDLTSTYFEGHGPEPLACHGYSRDHRPRDRQVQVGVVMAGGWPIAHHVFDGKIKDHQTVAQVVTDLRDRFDIGRVVFVGDRGMVSRETIKWLKKREVPYIVGLRRRRNRCVDEYLKATKSMEPICSGDLDVYEVDGEDGERVVIVNSPERLDYERGMRRKVMKRVWPKLKALQERVHSGRLRDRGKIGAAAQRIVSESHGYRYFSWILSDEGQLSVRVDREKLRREMRLEGTYVIATDHKHLLPLEVVQAYKELAGVERAFRESKDFLQLRPIYHRSESRVRAHIFVVALSFLLYRALEKGLAKAGVALSVRQALQALKSVRLVELESGGESRWLMTRPNHQAQAVLRAFGLGTLQSPTVVEKRAM